MIKGYSYDHGNYGANEDPENLRGEDDSNEGPTCLLLDEFQYVGRDKVVAADSQAELKSEEA